VTLRQIAAGWAVAAALAAAVHLGPLPGALGPAVPVVAVLAVVAGGADGTLPRAGP
jgi:hypothetical protein